MAKMNRKEIIDDLNKLSTKENVLENLDKTYKKVMEEAEYELGEIPEEVKQIAKMFFFKGYRISEEENLKILKSIQKLKDE
jgi:division protein CdvB (Snf7/Vps24/ESCRT-III family)